VAVPFDTGSPRRTTCEDWERLWTCTAVLDADARSVESLESESDVIVDLCDSILIGRLPLSAECKK
jgi:hypothetical protein